MVTTTTPLADGGYVESYVDSRRQFHVQKYTAGGTPVGDDHVFGDSKWGDLQIVPLSNGGYVAVEPYFTDVPSIYAHVYSSESADLAAHPLLFNFGKVAASPEGTTLTVRNLFSAVPARLKFLKSRNTEVSHCHHLLEQYALAYPEIRFSVTSDGRQIFATPGDGQLASALIEVYGLQVAQQMVPLAGQERPDEPGYTVVSGYTSRPVCYKSTRQHISFFVNRRWVMSRMLTAAVEEAYHSLLLTGRHPIAVVNIQLDPALLDVNVHPAKTEIRFLKERRQLVLIRQVCRLRPFGVCRHGAHRGDGLEFLLGDDREEIAVTNDGHDTRHRLDRCLIELRELCRAPGLRSWSGQRGLT